MEGLGSIAVTDSDFFLCPMFVIRCMLYVLHLSFFHNEALKLPMLFINIKNVNDLSIEYLG